MYQYIWDAETGGLLLTSEQSKFSKEPRPVYYRELDILGFDRYWTYPKDDSAPIMWAEANNYIYRGRIVARTKGGSIYDAPEIVLIDEPEPDGESLRPVDIVSMCQKNQWIMEPLIQDTIKNVYNEYRKFRNKVDIFHVSFTCPYPIHLFRELEIIDKELLRIRAQLINSTMEKAVIISDHGASRLAVIYQHENSSTLQLDEKGEHSGRCCPTQEDPNIPAAVYEDGYAVLGNYERFKGGRKANLEVHGGASLEEVVVPIITIALRPSNIVYYFVDPVIKYKVGQPSEIVLFSNIPMKEPKLLVNGIFYDGVFENSKNYAKFSMIEPKRVGEYTATIYEGNTNTGIELTFKIERNTKTRNLFDL